LADSVLRRMSQLFYAVGEIAGQASFLPEQHSEASLLIAILKVHSQCQFCKQLPYILLFK